VLGRAAARPDRADNHPAVLGGALVTPLDYDFLRTCLKARSGLVLSADKQYLVESRLLPVARKAGLANLAELVTALKPAQDAALMTAVVEAMTTNESFFFRDKTPFEHFRSTIMPTLLAARRSSRTIRIWCAAAATGQEPYSLAMCLKEIEAEIAGWRIELLATDLSGEVLEKARSGLYTQFEVQRGLPIQLLIRHFAQSGELWQIAPEIRAMVRYRQLNLLADFTQLGTFDLIFCRNVLIYFDQETKTDVLNRLARVIAQDGFLVLGAAETVVGLTDRLKMVHDKRGLYVPAAPASRLAPVGAPKPAPRLIAINGGR
jgi:chemotaxis protein methyltransferase CheR